MTGSFDSQMYWVQAPHRTLSPRTRPLGVALQALPTPYLFRARPDFGLTLLSEEGASSTHGRAATIGDFVG